MSRRRRRSVTVAAVALTAAAAACIERPLVVTAPAVSYVSVATTRNRTCGLSDRGEVWCWTRVDPRPRQLASPVPLASLTSFLDHACGLAADGTAYCWGPNTVGQLGSSDPLLGSCGPPERPYPCAPVPVPVDGDLAFTALSAGAAHTCGITAGGDAYCWGANGNGQLGAAGAGACVAAWLPDGSPCATSPVRVETDVTFRAISAGRNHTCAIASGGDAWCWGLGANGRLGHGTQVSAATPAPVEGGLAFRRISAGGSHTCGVTTAGVGYCWGSNSDLQLGTVGAEPACGNQLYRCVTTPFPVGGNLDFATIVASDAVPLAGAGPLIGGHSCGVTTDLAVYCWGLNTSGQVAGYDDLRTANPVPLPTARTFTDINAGADNTCGVTEDGELLCWAYGGPAAQWYVFPNG